MHKDIAEFSNRMSTITANNGIPQVNSVHLAIGQAHVTIIRFESGRDVTTNQNDAITVHQV